MSCASLPALKSYALMIEVILAHDVTKNTHQWGLIIKQLKGTINFRSSLAPPVAIFKSYKQLWDSSGFDWDYYSDHTLSSLGLRWANLHLAVLQNHLCYLKNSGCLLPSLDPMSLSIRGERAREDLSLSVFYVSFLIIKIMCFVLSFLCLFISSKSVCSPTTVITAV